MRTPRLSYRIAFVAAAAVFVTAIAVRAVEAPLPPALDRGGEAARSGGRKLN